MNDLDMYEMELAAYAYAHHTFGCLLYLYTPIMHILAPWRVCPYGDALGYGGGLTVKAIQPAIKRLREMRGKKV